MATQNLEPRPLLPEPGILAPGAPQRQVGASLQLGSGDQAGPAKLGDLLGIGQIRVLATELPGLADPKGRQRIDHYVPLAPSPAHVRDGLPQVPGRLEGEDAGTPGAADGGRRGAPGGARRSSPASPARVWGIRNRVNRCPAAVNTTGLVLGTCQVQADDHII